jgi:PAS domain-containing protein
LQSSESMVTNLLALLDMGSSLQFLGTERDQDFDELAELAASVCSAPIGLVNLIEGETVYFKGAAGFEIEQAPLADTLCVQTMRQESILVIPDALRDPRFARNPYVVGDPQVRFYAGTPLYSPEGNKIGTLCVLDTIPRELKQRQAHALHLIARQVNAHIELMARRLQMSREAAESRAMMDMFVSIAEVLPAPCFVKNREDRMLFYNQAFAERLRISRDAWLEKTSAEIGLGPTTQVLALAAENAFRVGRYVESDVEVLSTSGDLARWRLCQAPYSGPEGECLLAAVAIDLDPPHNRLWQASA